MQQTGMIEARQQPCLLNKAVASGIKQFLEALAAQFQRQIRTAYRQ